MMFDRWSRDGPVDGAGDLAGDLEGGHSVPAHVEEPTPVTRPASDGENLVTSDADDVDVGSDVVDADVDDVGAFLAGRLVEHWSGRGRSVPARAVVNKVAHAEVDELVDLGDPARVESGAREPAWRGAQRSLAIDLLDGAGRPEEVARIQREVLVPLELWLIERSETEIVSWRRAMEAAELVVEAVAG